MRSQRWLLLLCGVLIFCGRQPALSQADDAAAAWVDYQSAADLRLLTQYLDVWEVHGERDAGRLLAGIDAQGLLWLASHGFTYTLAAAQSLEPAAVQDLDCYRTVDDLYVQLAAWAAAYPNLTTLHTIGESYEKRPLLALRLTNAAVSIDKPIFFLMAGIHGRELIAPETAMVFIERLLSGYGVRADATWLLDYGIIEVLVVANPDGHIRNEPTPQWPGWRKNTNSTYGICGGTAYGVDLNRNFTFAWGDASDDPCAMTYQGPAPASEVETQAITTFVRTLFPDQRPDPLHLPAPETTAGLFITLHSYSELVLWPWSYTYASAPNAAALAQLGRKLARYNDYTAQQASDLYPASGTTDDFVYGELGIASYTFEIGSHADGFFPSCSRYEALVDPNVAALFYAAKVMQAPYLWPAGPEVIGLDLLPLYAHSAMGGTGEGDRMPAGLRIVADLDDGLSGGQAIVAAEVAVDTPPWLVDERVQLGASDGAFDTARETVSGTLSLQGLSPGRHLIFVRGQDAEGHWGAVATDFVTVGLRFAAFLPLVTHD